MSGRSEYNRRDALIIGGGWLILAVIVFMTGIYGFVTAQTDLGLVTSFVVYLCGLLVAGVWVEWWSR
jgi:hypothetical protein